MLNMQITVIWSQSLKTWAMVLQASMSHQGVLCPLSQSQSAGSQQQGHFALWVSASSVLEASSLECCLPTLCFPVLTSVSWHGKSG